MQCFEYDGAEVLMERRQDHDVGRRELPELRFARQEAAECYAIRHSCPGNSGLERANIRGFALSDQNESDAGPALDDHRPGVDESFEVLDWMKSTQVCNLPLRRNRTRPQIRFVAMPTRVGYKRRRYHKCPVCKIDARVGRLVALPCCREMDRRCATEVRPFQCGKIDSFESAFRMPERVAG
jgi:hypothetical protein